MCVCDAAIPSCPAQSEGLVRYPTTLAPVSGSDQVTTQCADNAHRTSFSLTVMCDSDGTWSGPIPLCECDIKYYEDTVNSRQICTGKSIKSFFSSQKKIFFFLQLLLPLCVRPRVKALFAILIGLPLSSIR